MPPNCHQWNTVLKTPCSCSKCKVNGQNNEMRTLTFCFAYMNLAISCVQTIYKAYINNDFQMVGFVIFVFFGYFALMKCFSALNQLPAGETSLKRDLLGLCIWGITTTMLFGFAYQFSTFMNLAASISLFSVAIVASVCLFYLHLIHGSRKDSNFCRRLMKIVAIWYFERMKRRDVDNERKFANCFYENV